MKNKKNYYIFLKDFEFSESDIFNQQFIDSRCYPNL